LGIIKSVEEGESPMLYKGRPYAVTFNLVGSGIPLPEELRRYTGVECVQFVTTHCGGEDLVRARFSLFNRALLSITTMRDAAFRWCEAMEDAERGSMVARFLAHAGVAFLHAIEHLGKRAYRSREAMMFLDAYQAWREEKTKRGET
jgi:hypothetical protein